ncbi:hypothetical protein CICLE_v100072362mg, partial [Citrus x clementina]
YLKRSFNSRPIRVVLILEGIVI